MEAANDTNTLLLVLIGIFVPPLGVFLKRGLGFSLLLNILLCLLLLLPGQIHAVLVAISDR